MPIIAIIARATDTTLDTQKKGDGMEQSAATILQIFVNSDIFVNITIE